MILNKEYLEQGFWTYTQGNVVVTGRLEALAAACMVPFVMAGMTFYDTMSNLVGRKESYDGGSD